MDSKQIGLAFLFTIIAGLSTGIGSLIAFFTKKPNKKFLSFTLGFSAGVMLYISMVELLKEGGVVLSAKFGNKLGLLYATLAFFGGIALILIIDRLVPEGTNPHEVKQVEDLEETLQEEVPINIDQRNPMLSEQQAHCSKKRKFRFRRRKCANNYDECIEFGDCKESNFRKRALLRSGLFTAFAIAIHNFPEGIATFFSTLQGINVALPIMIAISLHNIPEGISVSVPIYYATGSKKKAFFYSALSGFAEPLGAILAYLVLMPFFTPVMLGVINAFVAGIMVFIALDELIPSAIQCGEKHLPIYGIILGMALMAVSLIAFA